MEDHHSNSHLIPVILFQITFTFMDLEANYAPILITYHHARLARNRHAFLGVTAVMYRVHASIEQ